ncbi:MAG: DinB family protein [Phycisphaeraceae bacterium]
MPDTALRNQLARLLTTSDAHIDFERAVADLPAAARGRRPGNVPHTPWRLVEHMRLAQRDILDFSRNPDYREPAWPDDYWPADDGPPEDPAWQRSLDAFLADRAAMVELVNDPARDLAAPIPWGDGQTLLREALVLADHNAYHVGQLITVRRLLGAWQD